MEHEVTTIINAQITVIYEADEKKDLPSDEKIKDIIKQKTGADDVVILKRKDFCIEQKEEVSEKCSSD